MSAIEKVLKQCKEYGDEPQTFCASHVNDAIAELARLQAIAEAAELMKTRLLVNKDYAESCLIKEHTHIPVTDLFTDLDAAALAAYEKAVKP